MNINISIQIIVLFGLISIGYITNKTKVLDDTANRKFSTFLLKVALPATILKSAIVQDPVDKNMLFSTVLIVIAVFIIIPVMSWMAAKIFRLEVTYQLMLNYSNLGFMGFPIIESLYGGKSIFYGIIFMMVFNVHIFTHGIMMLQGEGNSVRGLLKKLCTPGIISAILAFLLVLFPIYVPTPVRTIITSIGNVTTPLAMIVIGSQLAQVSILKSLKNYRLYIMSLLKLVVYPVVIYLVLSLFIKDKLFIQTATILVGLPVAGNVTMLCSEYKGNISLAAEGICITTLLSLITIPLMMIFLS